MKYNGANVTALLGAANIRPSACANGVMKHGNTHYTRARAMRELALMAARHSAQHKEKMAS